MSALAERDRAGFERLAGAAAAVWRPEIMSLEAIEAHWRALEAEGIVTPYQRFDWVASYARHALSLDKAELSLVALKGPGGRVTGILPFAIKRRHGLVTASFAGGKHANFHMGVFSRDMLARLDQASARRLLAEAAAAMGGVDAFLLRNQPVVWDGVPNPLALIDPHPSPSQAYKLSLSADGEETLQRSMSAAARKKHRNKRARLADLGEARCLVAATEGDRERILKAFLNQKAERFAAMGIADPFCEPAMAAFLGEASRPRPHDQDPALMLAGLDLDGRIIATFIGARAQGRLSGMGTSFDADPAVAKVSPGEILMLELIRHECAAGNRVFDLGVGEARYKSTICNETEELVDSFVAISARGRLAAAASRIAQEAKARIKRSPLAHRLALRVARFGRPVTPPSADEPAS